MQLLHIWLYLNITLFWLFGVKLFSLCFQIRYCCDETVLSVTSYILIFISERFFNGSHAATKCFLDK